MFSSMTGTDSKNFHFIYKVKADRRYKTNINES